MEQICTKYPDTTRPNSVTVTKCVGPVTGSSLQHTTNHYTKPQSLIFKINIGDSCDINFTNTSSGATVTQRVDDNSLLMISQQSRDFFTQKLSKTTCAENSVHFLIVFRSVDRSYGRSTCVIGDSNTHHVYFHNDDNKRSVTGKSIYGKRI